MQAWRKRWPKDYYREPVTIDAQTRDLTAPVVALWSQKLNTTEIAKRLGRSEDVVCVALRHDLEARYNSKLGAINLFGVR